MSASTSDWRASPAADGALEGAEGEAELSDNGEAEVPPPPRSAPPPSLSIERIPKLMFSNFFFSIFDLSSQYFDGVAPVFGEALGSRAGHVEALAISLQDCGLLELLAHKGLRAKLVPLITENGAKLPAEDQPAGVLLETLQMSNVIAVSRQLR